MFALVLVGITAVTLWSVFSRDISADSVPFDAMLPGQAQVIINVAADGSTTVNGKHVASVVNERPDGTDRITYIATDAGGEFIDHLLVVINLPVALSADQVKLTAIGAYGVGQSSYQLAQPNQITYDVLGLSPQAIYTVQADLPAHTLRLPLIQQLAPFIQSLPFEFWLAIGLIFPLIAFTAVAIMVQRATSEWKHSQVSNELRETPPGNLAPALAGVLILGKMNARMLAATLIDLAERNFVIISNHGDTFTFGKRRNYVGATALGGELAPFEAKLLDKLFLPSAIKSTEADINVRLGHRLFSRKIAEVYLQVYEATTSAGYFVDNPGAVWQRYRAAGIVLLVLALAGFGLTLAFMSGQKYPLVSWVGMMVASLVIMQGAPLLPRRTPQGVAALREWTAFRNYLKLAQPIQNTNDPDLYRRYLAYAIAFGVEVEWTRRFAGTVFQAPDWLVIQGEFVKIDDFARQLFPIVGYVATEMAAVRDPNS